jgi:hypothetical protein
MKNSYLFLSLCFGILSGSSLAQDAYVAGNQKVKVNPNTLFYFGGNLTINSGVTTEKTVENAGNVKINGQFVNNGDATGKNFISTWTNATNYGQVIINQSNLPTTRLAMEKGTINPVDFEWGQFAIPYNFANANAAMNALFGTNYVQSSRYYSSMMVWDNDSKPEFDHLQSASPLSPGDYVILNLKYYSAQIKALMEGAAGGKLLYAGLPTNGAFSKTIKPSIYPTGNWDVWKEEFNSHGERYKTYIDDKLRTTTNQANYGKYHFQYGNPYTSNITLAYLGTSAGYDDGNNIANLAGVAKVNKTAWSPITGNGASSSMLVAKFDGTQWSGSADALIVKPFEPFILILEDGATGDRQINFSDKMKTFSMTAGVPVGPLAPIAPLNGDNTWGTFGEGADAEDRLINNSANLSLASASTKKYFYQAELSLYTTDGQFTGNKAFVVASNSAKNGVESRLESEYSDFEGRTGFYLAQEDPQGNVVESSARKMHINAIGLNYINKPIPFFFNRQSGDTSTYVVKSDLYFYDIFSKLTPEMVNYEDGNSFFFYDSVEDVLLPITTDFYYEIAYSPANNETTRYRLYWNATQVGGKDQMKTEDLIASSTVIYKDNTSHKVRFNENWDMANTLKVYDLSGRKVMEYFNVKTDVDFEINLPSRGIYVVKIESNTGDVYTQKIVK